MGARALLVMQDFEFVQHKHGRRSTVHAHTVGVHPASYSAGTLIRKISLSWWEHLKSTYHMYNAQHGASLLHPSGLLFSATVCFLVAKNSVASMNSSFFHAECPCCMSLLHVLALCPCCMSWQLVHASSLAACLCFMSCCMLCCMSMLHAHVNSACPCCMS